MIILLRFTKIFKCLKKTSDLKLGRKKKKHVLDAQHSVIPWRSAMDVNEEDDGSPTARDEFIITD